MIVKALILPLAAIAIYIAGCSTVHYQERQSDRVTFFLRAPFAKKVEFVSSLDAYHPQPARKTNGFQWVVVLATISEFKYFYLVDGSVYLPECEFYENDDFGSLNCVYVP